MSDSKQDISQTENGITTRPAKRHACKNHCKRFWWLYFILFIVVVLLVVLLIIFVAVPKVAQHKMDDAKLDIQGVSILQTEPDSYLMEINSTITTDGSIKAKVDPFEGSLYLAGVEDRKPFALVQFPETHAERLEVVNVSQRVQIKDMEAFKQFNTYFFQKDMVTITVEGRTKVKPRSLAKKYNVNFNKTLSFKGLNLLKGTQVTDGNVELIVRDGEPNFRGSADIPNASHFSLDLGNVTFTSFAIGQNIGRLAVDNLVLRPGVNKVNVVAYLDQLKVITTLRLPQYCQSGVVPFQLQGAGVTRNGKDIGYFSTALASANQTVDMDIASILRKSMPLLQFTCPS